MKKFDKEFRKIFVEMFKRVDLKFNEKYVSKPDWYAKHTWSEEESDKFRVWLVKYLEKNAKKMGFSKQRADKEASWFMLAYSWKTRYKNE